MSRTGNLLNSKDEGDLAFSLLLPTENDEAEFMIEKKDKSDRPEDYTNDGDKNGRWGSTYGEKGDRKMAEQLAKMMDKGRINKTE